MIQQASFWRQRIDRWLGSVLATGMALAVVIVLWQVISRYVLADPSSVTDELVRYLMVWIGLLGTAYAVGQRRHLAIDLLPTKLNAQGQLRLGRLIDLLIALFAVAVLIIGGGRLVHLTWLLGQTSAALSLPLGWVYLALPISGLIIVYYCFASSPPPSGAANTDAPPASGPVP